MEEGSKSSYARVDGLGKTVQSLPGLKSQSAPQPAQNSNQGEDWWTLQRKQQGQLRAQMREARLQREIEEKNEAQKLANRLHWEKMRQAVQEDPDQS